MAEEQIEQHEQHQGHADHAGVMGADQAGADERAGAERGRKTLDAIVPDPAGRAVEDGEQRDEHHDVAEHRRVVDRLEHDTLDGKAGDEGERDGQHEGDPVGAAPLDHLPGHEGREHRHLALGEIEMVDRLVDHHHGERDAGIDAAGRQPRHGLMQQQFPVHARTP
jgi:hypothetical protein